MKKQLCGKGGPKMIIARGRFLSVQTVQGRMNQNLRIAAEEDSLNDRLPKIGCWQSIAIFICLCKSSWGIELVI